MVEITRLADRCVCNFHLGSRSRHLVQDVDNEGETGRCMGHANTSNAELAAADGKPGHLIPVSIRPSFANTITNLDTVLLLWLLEQHLTTLRR